ncbi:MAG: amidohydrolase family protein [Robiginitomaculum sp.]|nr:amidohydrolase family protein [Robiginitomaculum sp.]
MSKFITLCLAFILLQTPAIAQTFAITGAKIVTNNGAIIEHGTIVFNDKKIIAVGETTAVTIPDAATKIDGSGKWVTPGLFLPFSQVGMVEIAAESSTNDTRSNKSPFSAALLAADSYNPKSENVGITKIEGITRMAILPTPSRTIYGGQGALVNTSGDFRSIRNNAAFIYVQMGETGARIAGGSRSASWLWLRQSLLEAKAWRKGREPAKPLLNSADAFALQNVLKKDLPFLVQVNRASDLLALIDFKSDFNNLNVVAVGAKEAWMVADELAKADITLIIDPHDNLPNGFESLGATMYNAVRLHKAGVKFAITNLSDGSFNARLMPQHAGNTLATGLDWDTAFAAITKVPAQIFREEDNLGRLATGMIADIVVWDGDPLEVMSSPDLVFIDGQKQDMTSRQTRLRDRYLTIGDENPLPFAYR